MVNDNKHGLVHLDCLRGCLHLVSNSAFGTEDDFFSTDKVLATQQ